MLYADTMNGAGRVLDADDKTGYVKQYFSAWTVNSAGDHVFPGAFTKTIQEQGPGSRHNRMKLLYHHVWPMMLATAEEVYEDEHGLVMAGRISQTSWGRDVLTLYRDGVITEGSIGYDIVRATPNGETDGLDIHEIKLYEGSPVAWGMNKDTPVISLNSADDAEDRIVGEIAATERVLRNADWKTDEMPELLTKQLGVWRAQLTAVRDTRAKDQRTTPNGKATPGTLHLVSDIAPSDLQRIHSALTDAHSAYQRM